MKDQETHYVECDCGSSDHLVKFAYAEADNYDPGHVYMSFQLSQWQAWYKRVWLAVKYVFGGHSRFGHWDCTTLDYVRLRRLNEFLGKAIAEIEKDPRAKHWDDENYDVPFVPSKVVDKTIGA